MPIPDTEIRIPPMNSAERSEFLSLLKTLVSSVQKLETKLEEMDEWFRGTETLAGAFETQRKQASEIKQLRIDIDAHIEDHKSHNTANWDWIKAGLLGAVGILVMVILWLVAEGHAS